MGCQFAANANLSDYTTEWMASVLTWPGGERGSSRIIVMQSWPKLNIFHEYKSYVAGNGWSSHAHQLTNKLSLASRYMVALCTVGF